MYFIADDLCVMHVYCSAMWRRVGSQRRVCVVGESGVHALACPQSGFVGARHVDGSNLTVSGLYAPVALILYNEGDESQRDWTFSIVMKSVRQRGLFPFELLGAVVVKAYRELGSQLRQSAKGWCSLDSNA